MLRSRLLLFFALSLFAWVIWIPQAAHRLGAPAWAPSQQSPLNVLTVWSPGLAAMFLAARARGGAGVGTLFRRLAVWRVPVRWYLVAVLLEPTRWVLALLIDRLSGATYELGDVPLLQVFGAASAFMIPVALVFTLPNALGEELGWRAYALPRLQRQRGPLAASVILGSFWGFWHVPMWIAWRAGETTVLTLLMMAANLIPAAILFTWIFNRTGGSLLLICLYHASMASKGYLLPKLYSMTEPVLLWVVAIAVVVTGGLRGAVVATEEFTANSYAGAAPPNG